MVVLTIASLFLAAALRAAPATMPTVDSELHRAAKPLVAFATWCGSNKAQSAGQAAMKLARSIVDSPDDVDAADEALKAAGDGAASASDAARRQQSAYEETANALESLAARKHDPADDAAFDNYLVKAAEISPQRHLSKLVPALGRAVKADRADAAEQMYAMLASSGDSNILRQLASSEKDMAAQGHLAGAVQKVVARLMEGDKPDHLPAAAYLCRLATIDAAGFTSGKYADAIVSVTGNFTIHVASHPMVAYASIPKSWNPANKSPVIFCFTGDGRDYAGLRNSYSKTAGELPYVIVSCATLSNTNVVSASNFKGQYSADLLKPYIGTQYDAGGISKRLEFDVPGILAIYKAVHDACNTEERMYITGFSGGGTPSYAMMILHPDLIMAAAPASANFYVGFLRQPGPSRGVMVQAFFGEKDGYNAKIKEGAGLYAQGEDAVRKLTPMGYSIKPKIVIPDTGHNAHTPQVTEFFETIRNKK